MQILSIEGKIADSKKPYLGRIEINIATGLIERLGKPVGKADLIFGEELIFPGFIDLHVHARENEDHSQDYKEDFLSASEAAINGGVTAFGEMPNNPVAPVDEKSYRAKFELAGKSLVNVLLYAGIGPSTRALPFPVPYKVFMGPSVGDLFFKSQQELEETIRHYEGQSVSFHCEDPEILRQNEREATHGKRRPKEAEIGAVDFALRLIEKYRLKGKLCHCSTEEAVAKIADAKQRSVDVTAEVAPHHLFFDETMIGNNPKMFQVNPPIRQNKQTRLALIKALKNGQLDYLATDHAPHTLEEKEKGVSGLPQLDTYGPFAAWLMAEHQFTPADIARVCSNNPGEFLGGFLGEKYGKIEKGFVGSLTVLDANKQVIISKEKLKTKCKWSPFEGVNFPGSAVYTIVRGKVYKNA